jgi:hypothetical protein
MKAFLTMLWQQEEHLWAGREKHHVEGTEKIQGRGNDGYVLDWWIAENEESNYGKREASIPLVRRHISWLCRRPEALGCARVEATGVTGAKLGHETRKWVTTNDEAFSLLLYNNYIEKWFNALQWEEQQRRLETLPSITTNGEHRWQEEVQ